MDHSALQPYRKSSDLGNGILASQKLELNRCFFEINSKHFMSSGFNGTFPYIHACSISKHCYEINLLKFQSLD